MTSQEYWKNREAEQRKHNIRDEAEYQKHIREIYQNMIDEIEKEINGFYGKYAKKEGITIAEARKRAAKADIEALGRKAAKYVKEKNFSQQANEEMRLYNMTMKVNRLELLKAQIGLEMVAGFDELQKYYEEILTERTISEFERQAGILGKTIQNNAKAANAIVNASFHNATYSDRIWMYQDMLKNELSSLLQTGLIQGQNPRRLATHLRKRFGVSQSNAERLMITELARVQTEAQKQSFERNGFEEYTFLALGNACPICKALDEKHFKVAKMMPGTNAPPVHPRCRCSVSAYENSEDYKAWLDYLSKGGTTEEWNKLKKSGKAVEKISGSGTIKSGAVSGARNPYGKAAEKHAKKYYGLVRSMTTDVQKIAKTTGYSEAEIQRIKNYIFMDEHDLGERGRGRFDPDYMMGESWRRLIEGKPEAHDLTMLRHEIMEQDLLEQGFSQDEAHRMTSAKYNYDKEAMEFYGKIKKFKKE